VYILGNEYKIESFFYVTGFCFSWHRRLPRSLVQFVFMAAKNPAPFFKADFFYIIDIFN